MSDFDDSFTGTAEFAGDDAAYSWWRDAHPDGFVLDVRARRAPLLHRASCPDVDRDERPGRLKAKGARQICAAMKSSLRAWAGRELPAQGMIERCTKCSP